MVRVVFFLTVFLWVTFTPVKAAENSYYMRSPKALLMGDAYTSVAQDSFTLFYNPANLARHSGFSLYPFNPQFSVTNPLDDKDRFSNFPSEPDELVQQFTGFPIHVSAGINPGFQLGNFALSTFANNTTTMLIRNRHRPTLNIDHRIDRGFIMGGAMKLWEKQDSHLAVGGAVKYNKRRSVNGSFPVFGTTVLDLLDSNIDDYKDVLDAFDLAEGRSWGYDFGLDYQNKTSIGTFAAGVAVLDIFGTHFNSTIPDRRVPHQPMNASAGASWRGGGKLLDYTLSFDLQQLTQKMTFTQRMRIGVEVGTPIIRAMAGFNAGYWTYGTQLSLGMVDLLVGFHSVELGDGYRHIQNKRAVIYLSLFDFSFDA